jgi:hypothetical protein
MKYLLMTEAEYYSAISAAKEFGRFPAEYRQKLIEAEAACRAREVPEWATHFARKETDEEIESGNSPKMSLVYVEEIKK